MASIYDLKPRFQALLRPICGALARSGVTANQITIGAVGLSIAAGTWIAMTPTAALPYLILPVVLFVRMALNALDGMLAREHDMKSPLGGVLNELGDVLSDAALYLPFGLHPDIPWWAATGVVVAAILTEMAGVVGVMIGASRRYDGPFGKSDRAVLFGALGLIIGLGVSASPWVIWVFGAAFVLSIVTVNNRCRKALLELESL